MVETVTEPVRDLLCEEKIFQEMTYSGKSRFEMAGNMAMTGPIVTIGPEAMLVRARRLANETVARAR